MGTSINTNIAAYYAQANIQSASNNATSSIARLSSGNAIVQASDNVAALATGTSLTTQVNALQTAGTNASQGSSLLQVADGALAQIQSILQQQQSLALQAQAGSLTDTDRGFLNQQFAALTNEIDSLASGTTFNGVNLINGSIAQGGSTSSNPLQNTVLAANASATVIAPAGFTDDSNLANTTTHAINNQGAASATYSNGAAFTGSLTTFTAGTTITQPNGTWDHSLYGNIGTAGTFTTSAVGAAGSITAYTINYTTADGTVYTGQLAANGTTGVVAGGVSVTLKATTNPNSHATMTFTTGGTGFATGADNSGLITAGLVANTTGVIYTSGSFTNAPTIVQPTGLLADPALHGDLSQGVFTAALADNATTLDSNQSTAKGYIITYTLNGTTYSGFLAGTNGGTGTAGDTGVIAGQSVTLSSGNNATNATIAFTTNTAFGAGVTAALAGNQSSNLVQALQNNFAGATALYATNTATVTGQTTQAGIGLVSATNDPTKNDTSFVGALSAGKFAVTNTNTGGYAVSYALNGSTYQGTLSATELANGGTLVLDNGTGSLAFAITGNSATPNTSTASATALQTALTNQFAGATAHAIHNVATTLASNGLGGTVPGSAITATSTAGSLLDGFTGKYATLTSSQYTAGATNLPPISDFTATGTGANTVFSVNIGGQTYTTQGTVNDTVGTVVGDTFDGSTGILNFYLNGDKTNNPDEVLKLNLAGAAISGSAKISTSSEVSSFVDALNSVFGGGGSAGSTGGLTFQLGSTSQADVTVNIGSATSTALFGGANLNISTANAAGTAAASVGSAINTVTALRAGVGALESQFNFAAAAIQSSTQNEQAAAGSLLDTNIATESTKFATEQVQLQAGISVLAQANQELQGLLKLIG